MIALDAHKRAQNEEQQLQQTSAGQTSVGQLTIDSVRQFGESYVQLCRQQVGNVTDVQQEVIIETTSITDSVQHQCVRCCSYIMLFVFEFSFI